jgi:hypothetical protein
MLTTGVMEVNSSKGAYLFCAGTRWLVGVARCLLKFLNASFDFAQGREIVFAHVWLLLLIGVLVGPVVHLWEWKRQEGRFFGWRK